MNRKLSGAIANGAINMQQLIMICLLILISNHLKADTLPYFATTDEIDFGAILFVPGNCTMNHEDGSFSDMTTDKMCGTTNTTKPGRYKIIAHPNRQVSIRVLQRNNEGDGIMFVPEGQIISDIETLSITAGITQEIDSGLSGVINIHLGGRLFITSSQPPASSFEITNVNGIKWNELP